MMEDRKRKLEELECHFKWKPEGEVMVCNITQLEPKLLTNIKESPAIAVQAYALLSYLFAVGNSHSDDIDYDKVDQYSKEALDRASTDGDRFVIIANKLHILFERRKTGELDKSFAELQLLADKLTNADKCRIKLMEAFALSRFGLNEYQIALQRYKESISLNPESPDGYFGVGMILGRIRRFHHGHCSEISTEEIESFKTAVELWKHSNPFPITWYAYTLACSIKPFSGLISVQEQIKFEEIESLFDIAVSLLGSHSGGSSIIYKWCAKGYKQMTRKGKLPYDLCVKYISKRKLCVDKACESNPTDSSSLHEAGIFYWRTRKYKNLEKAKDLLKKSSECCPLGNFLADIDYIRLRKQNEKDFSALDAYVALFKKYEHRDKSSPYDNLNLAILHLNIGLEVLLVEKDKDGAMGEFYKALNYDPKCYKVIEARDNLISIIQSRLDKSKADEKHKSDATEIDHSEKIKWLYELAKVYRVTEDYGKAKELFEQILDLDENNSDARFDLCNILFIQESYEQCVEHCNSLLSNTSDDMTLSVKQLLARSYYYIAVNSNSEINAEIPQAQKRLFESAKLGLINSCHKVLDILKQRAHNNISYHTTQEAYEICALLLVPEYFALSDNDDDEKYMMQNSQNYRDGLNKFVLHHKNMCTDEELSKDLLTIRKMRFEMTELKMKGKDMESIQIQVLSEARNQLDRAFRKFVDTHFKDVKVKPTTKFYYPYLHQPGEMLPETTQRLRKSQEGIELKLEHPKKGMGLSGFKSHFTDLFQFLCRHQPVYDSKYNFLPEFCDSVNFHKHSKSLSDKDLYDIAHSACEYVEEFVVELCGYLVKE